MAGSGRLRLGLVGLGLIGALSAGSLVVAPNPVSAAPIWLVNTTDPTPRPLGAMTVIGDSVLLGAGIYGPTLSEQLAARGWGPIRFRAGVGYTTGFFGNPQDTEASYFVNLWRSQGWDAPNVMINVGANDSNNCGGNTDCAYNAIMHLVDAIGPGHKIWWAKITRFPVPPYDAHQAAFNGALDRVASERSDFYAWDWPSVMKAGPYPSGDYIHLNPTGYRLRSLVMSREVTADFATAAHTGTDVALPAPIGSPAEFVPLPPKRLLDTRLVGTGTPVPGETAVEIDMTPYVPAGTTAVAVNLTSAASNGPGFLSGYPCDRPRSEVSNVNHAAGVPRGALAVVPLSAAGHLCVFTRATGHVIVDLQGAFAPGATGGTRLTPLATPDRLLDTRETGRAPVIAIPVPDGAEAVAVNLAVTDVTSPGWLKAYPCGTTVPEVSNVNYLPLDSVASSAFVPVSGDGTICVETLNPVDVIVDITGVFSPGGDLQFVPVAPTRMLDTRTAIGGWGPIHGSGQTLDVGVVPASAAAVTGTLTMVGPMRPDWLKAYPCGTEPPTSSVNGDVDTVFANAVTVGVSDSGRLCIKALAATQTLFDVTGWWIE